MQEDQFRPEAGLSPQRPPLFTVWEVGGHEICNLRGNILNATLN